MTDKPLPIDQPVALTVLKAGALVTAVSVLALFTVGLADPLLTPSAWPWLATGFLAGYLCALAIVYGISGHLGLPIAESRNPHYVTDLASLLGNLASRTRFLAAHLGALGRMTLGGLSIVAMA